jgi:hypothetical protein
MALKQVEEWYNNASQREREERFGKSMHHSSLSEAEKLAQKWQADILVEENGWGKLILRAQFPIQSHLEGFMLEMIGNPKTKGISSKAIGNVILVWQR